MNSGPTSERVYAALKRLILGHHFRPGERLDPSRLGDALSSSVTPVRDALHILAGEGLVDTRTGDGFQLPPIDEPGLKDLYAWHGQVLMLALRNAGGSMIVPDEPVAGEPAGEWADAAAALFAAIAARSANAEHGRAVVRASDRLRPARLAETGRIAGIEEELAALGTAFRNRDMAGLRRLLAAYHRRRLRAAAVIVRALYRTG